MSHLELPSESTLVCYSIVEPINSYASYLSSPNISYYTGSKGIDFPS